MAESVSSSKIECRSKRAIASIFGAINEHIDQIVGGSSNSTTEDKDKCKLRFREIYESALQQNILLDGEEWSHADNQDETSEFEPIDTEKKNFINNELVPNLDNAIVCVARKRKLHPRFCEEEVYEAINKSAFYLAKVEVQNDGGSEFAPREDVSLLTDSNLKTQLDVASSTLGSITKTVTSSVENAEKLQTAVSILQQPSKTDKIIFDSDRTNGMNFENPLKSHCNGTIGSFVSSSCGTKPAHHQDYVVQF